MPGPVLSRDLYDALRARLRHHHDDEDHYDNGGSPDLLDNTAQVKIVIADLVDSYPRSKLTRENVDAFVQLLDDLPAEELRVAAAAWTLEHEFPPAISDLRGLVIERRLGLPDAMEAWGLVEQALRMDDEGETYNRLPDSVRQAVRMIGGTYAYRTTQHPDFLRRDFVTAYEALRAQAIREANHSMAGLPGPQVRHQLGEGGGADASD